MLGDRQRNAKEEKLKLSHLCYFDFESTSKLCMTIDDQTKNDFKLHVKEKKSKELEIKWM